MKIYLSKYWINNSIFILGMIAVVIFSTVAFCVLLPDEENYIIALLSAAMVALQCFLLSLSLKLVRYVTPDNDFLVMYSFRGKRLSSVDYNSKTYFRVFKLSEGVFSTRDFVVLSNKPIEIAVKNVNGLAQLCKAVDLCGDGIIMPYPNPYMEKLKSEVL